MRLFVLLLLGVFLQFRTGFCVSVKELEGELKRDLTTLKKYRESGLPSFDEHVRCRNLLSQTIANIGNVLADAPSRNWGNPSPERLERIAAIGRVIAPYNTMLVDVGFSEDPALDTLRSQARILLKYTVPDQSLADNLRSHVQKGGAKSVIAGDLLFEHRMLSAADAQSLAEEFSSTTDVGSRFSHALLLSKLQREEVLPALAEMLDKPFTLEGTGSNTGVGFTENKVMTNCRNATDAIAYLGPVAEPLLPLLLQRKAEVTEVLPEPERRRFLGMLQFAIDRVEGKRPVEVPYAMNGSGLLLAASSGTHASEPTAASSIGDIAPEFTKDTETPAPPAASKAPDVARTLPSVDRGIATRLWAIGAFLLLVSAVFIWMLKRRK